VSTPISRIGEFGLISRIAAILGSDGDEVMLGIGDDCAVLSASELRVDLLTADALIEGIHFDLTYTSFRHLGWKSLVASLSDVAAMNGRPRAAVVTIALPSKIDAEMIEEFYRGMRAAGMKYSCPIVGGDTVATYGNMAVSVTVLGTADRTSLTYRSGAVPGDLLCASGTLGASVAGLKVLASEKQRYLASPETFQPNIEEKKWVIERHLAPVPRFDVLDAFVAAGVKPSAMIDLSDGLSSDARHLAEAGSVRIDVRESALPIAEATRRAAADAGDDALEYALSGGEDYELLWTMTPGLERRLRGKIEYAVIGSVAEGSGVRLEHLDGSVETLVATGYEHFDPAKTS
jgi:thiamine-monophosphate kinase